jgi:hypothetical protein
MKRIDDNPFFIMPENPLPDRFYGSQQLVRQVLESVSSPLPRDLEIYGLPGMGKTALLRYIANPEGALAKHRAWLLGRYRRETWRIFPVLVEYRNAPTSQHPFIGLYEEFISQASEYHDRYADHLAKGFIPSAGWPDIEGMQDYQAVDLLESEIKRLAQPPFSIRPILMLDDFDLAFEKMQRDQTTRLRPWRELVTFVLATERPLQHVNPDAVGSPFFQTMPLIRIGGLLPDEARHMLDEPSRQAKHPFPKDDIEFLLECAGGHAYLLILAGKELWDFRDRLGLLAHGDQPLSREQRIALRGILQEDFVRTFRRYMDYLEPIEEEALRLLVSQGPEALSPDHYKAMGPLESRGILKYNTNREYEPFSPLFTDFLKGTRQTTLILGSVTFTGLENSLLQYLQQNADRLCTFEEISREVWNQIFDSEDQQREQRRRMQVTISRLRKKLVDSGRGDIVSVREQGYRFAPPETG